MPDVDLSAIVNDPLFAQGFVIERSTGSGVFELGGYSPSPQTIAGFGTIEQSPAARVEMTPEGDRIVSAIIVWSSSVIYKTNPTGISDIIVWMNEQYKVDAVNNRSDLGNYWRAECTRIAGN